MKKCFQIDPKTGMIAEDLDLKYRFELVNLEELFRLSEPQGATIINNSHLIEANISKGFTDAIYTNCDGELGFVPTCQCGHVKGVSKVGLYCKLCDTTCSSQFIDTLIHNSWISIPDFCAPVLHPIWYQILRDWTSIGKSHAPIIDLLLNPELEVPDDVKQYIPGRGYQYFYDNHDFIMDILLHKCHRTARKAMTPYMPAFYAQYKDVLFTRKLPILHTSLHPIKRNGDSMRYVDSTSTLILEAIIDLSCFAFKHNNTNIKRRGVDKTIATIYGKILNYYEALLKQKICGKNAIIRKNCFGTRIDYSYRAVCSPQTTIHPLDIIVPPWCVTMTVYKHIILNYLRSKHGHTFPQALYRYSKALSMYDPIVEDCVREYIKNHPRGAGQQEMGRNPSIDIGSSMMMGHDDFGTDPADKTLAINGCIVKPANIDFDGDTLWVKQIWENDLRDDMDAVSIPNLMASVSTPGLSNQIGLLQENWVTLENYLSEEDDIDYYEVVSRKEAA